MRYHRDRGIHRPKIPDFSFQFDFFGRTYEWSTDTARERHQTFKEDPLPVAMGLVFASAPFVVGAVGVAYAPPPYKPVFATMMVPTGIGEMFWFGVGYGFGKQLQDW